MPAPCASVHSVPSGEWCVRAAFRTCRHAPRSQRHAANATRASPSPLQTRVCASGRLCGELVHVQSAHPVQAPSPTLDDAAIAAAAAEGVDADSNNEAADLPGFVVPDDDSIVYSAGASQLESEEEFLHSDASVDALTPHRASLLHHSPGLQRACAACATSGPAIHGLRCAGAQRRLKRRRLMRQLRSAGSDGDGNSAGDGGRQFSSGSDTDTAERCAWSACRTGLCH